MFGTILHGLCHYLECIAEDFEAMMSKTTQAEVVDGRRLTELPQGLILEG